MNLDRLIGTADDKKGFLFLELSISVPVPVSLTFHPSGTCVHYEPLLRGHVTCHLINSVTQVVAFLGKLPYI